MGKNFGFLEKCFNDAKNTFNRNQVNNINNNRFNISVRTIVLPYYNNFVNIKNIINHNLNIRIVFNYKNNFKNLLIKNSPNSTEKGGVYKIPCTGCDKYYIGMTGKN